MAFNKKFKFDKYILILGLATFLFACFELFRNYGQNGQIINEITAKQIKPQIFLFQFQNMTILFTMILMNFIMYMIVKEKRYLLHSLYLLVMLLFLLQISGVLNFIVSLSILSVQSFMENFIYLITAVEAVIFTSVIMSEIKSEKLNIQELELEAKTDKLTGLYNRNYFDKVILPQVYEYEQDRKNISLFMLDIDHFKNINDTLGHNVGDILLSELANIITSSVRKQDCIIRWGGEEFIIVMFETNIYDAAVLAEKTREIIENYDFEYVKHITVSIGVTEKCISDTNESWVKKADEAMYRAKSDGRNRISVNFSNILPIKINWSSIFDCKNYQINTEHRELVFLMNKMIEEWSIDGREDTFFNLFEQLLASTKIHFANEEIILEKKEYPLLEIHKHMHQLILQEADEIKNLLIDHQICPLKVIEFLIDIVVGHMISEDIGFYKYL
ncbi:diguanylate cyclase [Lachnotalea glycerini]|uniref:Diguanylate cyclase n=1 Tax=Lachnotalea glycerini TaxID=1763509 RepID=A0A371JAV0_9FIRM|nr:diguanylate cyclase [Lachnotalea glycerini]RDY29900.1 diguanylate cyclase [Lachnotalea glycerini]